MHITSDKILLTSANLWFLVGCFLLSNKTDFMYHFQIS